MWRIARDAVIAALVSGVLLNAGIAQAGSVTPAVAGGSTVLTPAGAVAVVKDYIAANNRANAHWDLRLQNAHETGSAAVVDDAYFRIGAAVGLPHTPAFVATALKVYLPRQTRYPAVFVAYYRPKPVGKPAAKYTNVALFQRASSRDRWRVSNEPYIPAGYEVPRFDVDAAGYIPAWDPASMSVPAAQLNRWWVTAQFAGAAGRAPAKAWARTSLLKGYASDTSSLNAATQRLVTQTFTFAATRFPPVCLASRRGALCFLSTNFSVTATVPPALRAAGYRLWILSSSDQYASGGLPLGRNYTGYTVTSEREAAIDVPRKHAPGGLRLDAEASGRLHGVGTHG